MNAMLVATTRTKTSDRSRPEIEGYSAARALPIASKYKLAHVRPVPAGSRTRENNVVVVQY